MSDYTLCHLYDNIWCVSYTRVFCALHFHVLVHFTSIAGHTEHALDQRIHTIISVVFFLIIPPPPKSTLFPYTTLFRSLCGQHPELGQVTLSQLLASWVVHDLGHIAQISRVMAKQYTAAVGPWKAYLPVLTR